MTARKAADGDAEEAALNPPVPEGDAEEAAPKPPVLEDMEYYSGLVNPPPEDFNRGGESGATTDFPINLPSYLLLVLATVASIAFTGSIFEVTGGHPEVRHARVQVNGRCGGVSFLWPGRCVDRGVVGAGVGDWSFSRSSVTRRVFLLLSTSIESARTTWNVLGVGLCYAAHPALLSPVSFGTGVPSALVSLRMCFAEPDLLQKLDVHFRNTASAFYEHAIAYNPTARSENSKTRSWLPAEPEIVAPRRILTADGVAAFFGYAGPSALVVAVAFTAKSIAFGYCLVCHACGKAFRWCEPRPLTYSIDSTALLG